VVTALAAEVERATSDPGAFRATTAAEVTRLIGKAVPATVLDRAWEHVDFTLDPLLTELAQIARDAASLGYTQGADIAGLTRSRAPQG
jgi:hypothetical protein